MSTEAHSPELQHHFDSMEQQRAASTLGMWAFVAQELMFFGGLFTAYLVYRFLYGTGFELGSAQLDIKLGGINTAVLIGSSFTMAMAVWAAQTGKKKLLLWMLIATLALGAIFSESNTSSTVTNSSIIWFRERTSSSIAPTRLRSRCSWRSTSP